MQRDPPARTANIPALCVLGMSVAKPAYRKTAPVVVRNNYCSGRRSAAITYPFTRSVLCPTRKFSRNTARRITDIGIRLAAGDELRASKLFLLFTAQKIRTPARRGGEGGIVCGCFGYIESLAIRNIVRVIRNHRSSKRKCTFLSRRIKTRWASERVEIARGTLLAQNVFLFSRAGSLNGFHLDLPKNPVLERINDRAEPLTVLPDNIRRRFDLHRLQPANANDIRSRGERKPSIDFLRHLKSQSILLDYVSRSERNLILTHAWSAWEVCTQVSRGCTIDFGAGRASQYYSRNRQRKFIVCRRDVLFWIKFVYRRWPIFVPLVYRWKSVSARWDLHRSWQSQPR